MTQLFAPTRLSPVRHPQNRFPLSTRTGRPVLVPPVQRRAGPRGANGGGRNLFPSRHRPPAWLPAGSRRSASVRSSNEIGATKNRQRPPTSTRHVDLNPGPARRPSRRPAAVSMPSGTYGQKTCGQQRTTHHEPLLRSSSPPPVGTGKGSWTQLVYVPGIVDVVDWRGGRVHRPRLFRGRARGTGGPWPTRRPNPCLSASDAAAATGRSAHTPAGREALPRPPWGEKRPGTPRVPHLASYEHARATGASRRPWPAHPSRRRTRPVVAKKILRQLSRSHLWGGGGEGGGTQVELAPGPLGRTLANTGETISTCVLN